MHHTKIAEFQNTRTKSLLGLTTKNSTICERNPIQRPNLGFASKFS
uniref:Uncharacterized protein n=1 Tax=Rhizophora mucronata TaxID=61149 RepID=A0A2P2Q4K8_RHIMU